MAKPRSDNPLWLSWVAYGSAAWPRELWSQAENDNHKGLSWVAYGSAAWPHELWSQAENDNHKGLSLRGFAAVAVEFDRAVYSLEGYLEET